MSDILAQRLRQCRKACGFTQKEAAIYSDITEHAYQNYELGAREPRVSILMKIAELYKVSMDYLVGLTDEPNPYPRSKK